MTARLTSLGSFAAALAILAGGCALPAPQQTGSGHLGADALPPAGQARIPPPVQRPSAPPKPKAAPKAETYSVVVKDVRAQELLFALARDAKLNVDVHPGISGTVTLNAIDQTLPQLLARIAKQVDMRFELDGPNLVVMPDAPFLRTYKVDYVNMSRDTTGSVTVTTQIGSPGSAGVGRGSGGSSSGGASGTAGSSSATKIENTAKHHFWETLIQNIKDILQETDKEIVVSRRSAAAQEQQSRASESAVTARGEGAGAVSGGAAGLSAAGAGNQSTTASGAGNQSKATESDYKDYKTLLAANVIANPETGIVTVRATGRQHEKIQGFLDQVMTSAKRQVLIEATIAEVQLSENYQQGIDWERFRTNALGFSLVQAVTAGSKIVSPASALFTLTYENPGSRIGDIKGTAKLLEAFGNVKVLSSPKISVLNNQTAVLKVVDNTVYFTIDSQTNQNQTQTVVTYTTTVYSVPVGFVMNVTPQIADNDTVLLNVRPTLSRIIGMAADPNPVLKQQGITNEIPIIRSRELESVLRIENGSIAVMGGLMEDMLDNTDNAVPGLYKAPVLGNLFTHRNDVRRKTELVIFLRPTVIRDPSLQGDYQAFRGQLPDKAFFDNNPGPEPVPEVPVERRARQ